MLAHREGQGGADWGEAGPGTEVTTEGPRLGNSPRCSRLTKYEPCEQSSLAPIKTAETVLFCLDLCLRNGSCLWPERAQKPSNPRTEGPERWVRPFTFFGDMVVLVIPYGALNFHEYPNLF